MKEAEIVILLAISLVCDIRTKKIKNYITLSFAGIGLITNFICNGFKGATLSLLGWFGPVAILFILHVLKMLGAGDIKLFAAIGAIMGFKFAMYAIFFSFLAGGIIGIAYLALRKNFRERFKYFIDYLKSCLLAHRLTEYKDFVNKGDKDSFRFTFAAVPGTLAALICALVK